MLLLGIRVDQESVPNVSLAVLRTKRSNGSQSQMPVTAWEKDDLSNAVKILSEFLQSGNRVRPETWAEIMKPMRIQ